MINLMLLPIIVIMWALAIYALAGALKFVQLMFIPTTSPNPQWVIGHDEDPRQRRARMTDEHYDRVHN